MEEYLEVALLAEGQSKTDLEALLASVDEHNKDYVMKYLKSDCEAYVSTHVSEDLRKSDAVVTSVRQDFGLKYFNIILADYQAMSKFVPEVRAAAAQGMSMEEAQALLGSLRSNSLELFMQNLESHLDGVRASILEENPMLAEKDMQPILDDMLQDCKQKVYYKELQTALEGPQGKVVWHFVPKANPDELATPAQTEEALHKLCITKAWSPKKSNRSLTQLSQMSWQHRNTN